MAVPFFSKYGVRHVVFAICCLRRRCDRLLQLGRNDKFWQHTQPVSSKINADNITPYS